MKKPTLNRWIGPSGTIYNPWWCNYTYSLNIDCDICKQTSECIGECTACKEDNIAWNIQENERLYNNRKQDRIQITETGTWEASSGTIYTLAPSNKTYLFLCPICNVLEPKQSKWCSSCEADAIEWNNRGLSSFPLNIT
jgi:hypothetical protein